MTEFLKNFHFLRPWWLVVLVPAFLLAVVIWRRQAEDRVWRGIVAEHLLRHLLVGADKRGRLRPVHLLMVLWMIGTVALAGPAWRREPSPFTEDTAALVIAVKVTPTMEARDIQPSRLQRSGHKIKDLLALRRGARTALIAYAGSAHLVMPMTRDARIIEVFAMELSPRVMPKEGDAVGEAIALANEQLTMSDQPGAILLITDSIAMDQIKTLDDHRRNSGAPVHILAVAGDKGIAVTPDSPPAPALDRDELNRAADAAGGTLTVVSPDDRDVRRLAGIIDRRFSNAAAKEGGERWQDAGYWLVPVMLVLCLLWFRPGWTVRWD